MNNFKRNIYKTSETAVTPTTGVLIPDTKKGDFYCLSGFCNLNTNVFDITVYSSDGNMTSGQHIYTDIGLTAPYTGSAYVQQLGATYVFKVMPGGLLVTQCAASSAC